MVPFLKLILLLVQIFCIIVSASKNEKSSHRVNFANREQESNENRGQFQDAEGSPSEQKALSVKFDGPFGGGPFGGPFGGGNYHQLGHLAHQVRELRLIVQQIIHACPCARRVCSNPWSPYCRPHFGTSTPWGSSSGVWGSSSGSGHWGSSSGSGPWGSSSGSGQWGGAGSSSGNW